MKIGSPRRSRSPPRREELARAHRGLQPGIALDRLDLKRTLRLLERVAALVVSERLGVLAPILERLAEREAEMIAVLAPNARRRLLRAHPLMSSSVNR